MQTRNKSIVIILPLIAIALLLGGFIFWKSQSPKELTNEEKMKIATQVIDDEENLSEGEKQLYKGLAQQALEEDDETAKAKYPIEQIDRNTPAKLAYYTIGVTNVEEKDAISSNFGEPQGATEGTRFVVITLNIVNTTKEDFEVTTDNFKLIDQKEREYSDKSLDYGIDNYLDYKTIAPDIQQTGVLLFEVPTDSTSFTLKATSEDAQKDYRIKL